MQITNMQLNESMKRLEERVGKLESRMDRSDDALKLLSDEIKNLSQAVYAARVILMFVSPIITAVIVLVIQHFWR